jgi:uncharacterized membrane protein
MFVLVVVVIVSLVVGNTEVAEKAAKTIAFIVVGGLALIVGGLVLAAFSKNK